MPPFSRRKLADQPGLGFGSFGMGGGAGSMTEQAAEVLALAKQTADQAVADAESEAQRILSEARQEADRIIAEARTRAQSS